MIRVLLGLRLLLVLAVVVSTQGLLLVQGTYLLRQEYVASMLCVNRFDPESDCNGKCFLKEQMERHGGAGDHSDEGHERSPALLEVALSVRALISSAAQPVVNVRVADLQFLLSNERHVERLLDLGVFHPPRLG